MASFLDDLGKTIFGQQDLADYNQVSSADLLGRATGLLPQIGAFNAAIGQQQVGLIPIEQQLRAGRFGSAINPLQDAYTGGILSNLNLGNALPQDLQQELVRNAMQTSAASGFGLSPGGRALTLRDLGRESLDVGRQRRGEAFSALQAFGPQAIEGQLTPTTALDLERASINEGNMRRQAEASNRNANRAAIISSLSEYAKLGGAVAGEFAGSAFGTKGFGSMLSGLGGAAGSMGKMGSVSGGSRALGGGSYSLGQNYPLEGYSGIYK